MECTAGAGGAAQVQWGNRRRVGRVPQHEPPLQRLTRSTTTPAAAAWPSGQRRCCWRPGAWASPGSAGERRRACRPAGWASKGWHRLHALQPAAVLLRHSPAAAHNQPTCASNALSAAMLPPLPTHLVHQLLKGLLHRHVALGRRLHKQAAVRARKLHAHLRPHLALLRLQERGRSGRACETLSPNT